jgi:uncharacterized protein YjbI with pentapeptide repeats
MADKIEVENNAIRNSVFKNTDMSGTVFENVNLSGSTFHNVNLGKCSVDDACMAQTTICDFNWVGTRIEGILVSDLLETYEKVHGPQPDPRDAE